MWRLQFLLARLASKKINIAGTKAKNTPISPYSTRTEIVMQDENVVKKAQFKVTNLSW
jgi:hypothetical protein